MAEGYLETRQGAPVRVARGVRAHAAAARRPVAGADYAYDFTPGLPDLAGFPRDRWLRSLRSAWRETRAATPSATATRAARPSCARRWPTTWAACAARRPTRST